MKGTTAFVLLGCRYNPFIPGKIKIKNEEIRLIILLVGAAATAIWIAGELMARHCHQKVVGAESQRGSNKQTQAIGAGAPQPDL